MYSMIARIHSVMVNKIFKVINTNPQGIKAICDDLFEFDQIG